MGWPLAPLAGAGADAGGVGHDVGDVVLLVSAVEEVSHRTYRHRVWNERRSPLKPTVSATHLSNKKFSEFSGAFVRDII